MKIAIVHNLPSGGAKVVLYEWIKRLQKNHLIDEYCLSSSDMGFYDTKGIPHSRFIFKYKKLKRFPPDNKLQYLNFIFSFFDIFRLKSVYKNIAFHINARNYDITFMFEDRFTQAPLCSRWLSGHTVDYIQGYPFKIEAGGRKGVLNSIFNFLYPKYMKWLTLSNVKSASNVLVNSKSMQNEWANVYGIKSEVCYSGVDVERFRDLNIQKENFILSVGALIPDKGHDFVIEALGKVDKSLRPSLKIIYDRGPEKYKNVLLSLARKNDVDIFFGSCTPEELVTLYNKALFVACAQIHESISRVPLEAMACGTPVIAVNEKGFEETVINGRAGISVEREPYKFASAMTLLLRDEGIRKKYLEEAYQWVINNWSWEIHIKKLEKKLL